MDAAFLESTVAPALIQGLAATVEFQPEDSVEFLGRFLLKYAETEERKAKLKAEQAQLEIDAKEADVKAAAEKAAKTAAEAKATASAKLEADVASRLAAAPQLTQKEYEDVLNYLQKTTGATGVYVAVKTGDGSPDDEEPKGTLEYVGACTDHAFMVGKSITQPNGATFAVWVRPPAPEADEDEELDEDGNPKPKPPPPELQPLIIPNVLRHTSVEFFRVPRLGGLLAVPFEFTSYLDPATSPPAEAEPAAAAEGDDSSSAPQPADPNAVPKGTPKHAFGAIVLDTLGQHKQFSPSEVENVKAWAKRLAEALNRSEVVVYEDRYRKLQEAKAAAAAAAAAEAAAPPPAEGDTKEEE